MSVFPILIEILFSLFIYLFTFRFLLQLTQADYNNPISQSIDRLSSFFLKPLRYFLPKSRLIDFASLIIAILLSAIKIKVYAPQLAINSIFGIASISFILIILEIMSFFLFIRVLISWVSPSAAHPAAQLVYQVTDIIIKPFQKVLPPLGGLDLSVLVAFLLLFFIEKVLLIWISSFF